MGHGADSLMSGHEQNTIFKILGGVELVVLNVRVIDMVVLNVGLGLGEETLIEGTDL